MAHIKEDHDTSIGRDSVFDWGFGGSSKSLSSRGFMSEGSISRMDAVGSGKQLENDGPSSRYDPKAMSRIVDITDLVDDDSDDNDNDENAVGFGVKRGSLGSGSASIKGKKEKKKRNNPTANDANAHHQGYNAPLLCRQVFILTALVGIILGASIAIGYAILGDSNTTIKIPFISSNAAIFPAASNLRTGNEEQAKLELAQRVTVACSESSLDADIGECQTLCRDKECCFSEDEEYSCAEDDTMNCAVYAGCEALVEGISVVSAAADIERTVGGEEAETNSNLANLVDILCDDSRDAHDIKACQTLCLPYTCCFITDPDENLSCAEDESMNCSLYAGCKALVQLSLDNDILSEEKELEVEPFGELEKNEK